MVAKTSGKTFKAKQVTRPRDQVESQLREAILNGNFAQGEKLPAETELASQFGVSRPTVREALGALVTSGLIRKIPGVTGGSFVNTVTPDSLSQMLSESMDTIVRIGALSIDEITEVRRVLEIPAAQWAARNRTQADLDEMKRVVEIQKKTTIDDPDIPSYDLRFHSIFMMSTSNPILSDMVNIIRIRIRIRPEI
jgi:DNA-binding FadR family transcriptional regulator